MSSSIAAAIFIAGIAGLFWLNYDPKVRTSKALWIPVIWMLIAGSRAPSTWFQAPTYNSDMYLDGNPFERNLFSLLLLAALIVAFQRGNKIVALLQRNWPLVLFIAYCLISLIWSDYPSVGFKRWTKLVGDLVMVLIVVTEANPSGAIDRLMSRTSFLIIPVSLLFIRYFPALGRSYDGWTGMAHWTGVTQNKNSLGMICMLIGLGSLWRVIREVRRDKAERQRGVLIANATILLLVLYLLHMADSATSSACLFLGGFLMILMSYFQIGRRPALMHLASAGIVSLAAFSAFFDLAGVLRHVGRNSDLTGRTIVWSAALSMPVSRLVGSGYESFWVGERLAKLEAITGVFLNQAHDGYVEILVNLGWIGIFFLGLIIAIGYWRLAQNARFGVAQDYRGMAFFIAALIYNFTEASFKMTVPIWICFVWAIVAVPPMAELETSPVLRGPLANRATGKSMVRTLAPAQSSKPVGLPKRLSTVTSSNYPMASQVARQFPPRRKKDNV